MLERPPAAMQHFGQVAIAGRYIGIALYENVATPSK